MSLFHSDSEGCLNTLAIESKQANKNDAILQNQTIKQTVGFTDPATSRCNWSGKHLKHARQGVLRTRTETHRVKRHMISKIF